MRVQLPTVCFLVCFLTVPATSVVGNAEGSSFYHEWDLSGLTGDLVVRFAFDVPATTCALHIEVAGLIDETGPDYYFADDSRADAFVVGTDGLTVHWGFDAYGEFEYSTNNEAYAVRATYEFEWEGRQQWIIYGGKVLAENPFPDGRPFLVSVACDAPITNVAQALDTAPYAEFLGEKTANAIFYAPYAGLAFDESLEQRDTHAVTLFRVQQFSPGLGDANLTLAHPDGEELVALGPRVMPDDATQARFAGGPGPYRLTASGAIADLGPTLAFLADFAPMEGSGH